MSTFPSSQFVESLRKPPTYAVERKPTSDANNEAALIWTSRVIPELKNSCQNAFLAAYVELGSVVAAARVTRIGRQCHYIWLKKHPDYKAAFSAAEEECKRLELESRKRVAEDEDRLRLIAQQFSSATRARNTLNSYGYNWKKFCDWCEVQGHCPLPADEDTVLLWATSILASGHKVSTASVCVAAVAFHHRHAREASPVGEQVRTMLSGARRTRLEVPKQKRPLSVAGLRRISAKLETGDPILIRDRAIFVLGFAGAFRCSELRGLNLEDVEFAADGLLVQLRRSKTDQEGEGRSVAIFRGKHPETCPVLVLERWLTVRGRAPGPLFMPTKRGYASKDFTDKHMSRETMRSVMRRGLERAGLDRRLYSGHSLRAGYVTAAAENGATALAIMRQTGHKSAEMVLRYFRPVEAFRKNPLEDLL